MKKTITNSILIATLAIVGLSNVMNAQPIAAGNFHSLFLCTGGAAQAVGWNENGQLGDGTTVDQSTPVQVSGLTGITSLAAGGYHSLFLKNDGTVWVVGDNDFGQLGDGTIVDTSTPVQVAGLCSVTGVKENSMENAISVYPNPCNEQLFIELTDYKNTIAEIFNLQGQLLQSIPLQTFKTTLQINHLTSGIYLVQVKSPKGMIVKKVVKN